MSEDQVDAAGSSSDAAAKPEGTTDHRTTGDSVDSKGHSGDALFRLWMKAGGWFVMSIGVVTILLALHALNRLGELMPLALLVATVLIGASYVLAGYGMTEGYVWPLPLGLMACILSPTGLMVHYINFLFLAAAFGFYRLIQQHTPSQSLNRSVPQTAALAFGLWIGGVTLIVMFVILSAGGH